MCAQVAERQGRYLAKLLNTLDSKPIHQQAPYQFKSLGMLAYIGGFQALSELPADIKLQGTSCIKLHDILPFFTGCVIALPSATHFLFPYSVCINVKAQVKGILFSQLRNASTHRLAAVSLLCLTTINLRSLGVPSWLLWRSAYLTRLGSWRLRMQVPIDWMKTLLFGRDISRIE